MQQPMAGPAENLARKFESRAEEQDKYALRSQQEAKARSSTPGYLRGRDRSSGREDRAKERSVISDDHPRPNNLEGWRS
jgi:acetyl-CoA acetyltransferase